MKGPWKVAVCSTGFRVVKPGVGSLVQRWHWANHQEGDPRRRPHVGMWVCRSRPLIFTDYRKALRTVARLNATFEEGCRRYRAHAARAKAWKETHK